MVAQECHAGVGQPENDWVDFWILSKLGAGGPWQFAHVLDHALKHKEAKPFSRDVIFRALDTRMRALKRRGTVRHLRGKSGGPGWTMAPIGGRH